MTKKLYRVESQLVFYVLAEENDAYHHAEFYMSEAINDNCAESPDVEEVTDPIGIDWENGTLVYGHHDDDISIEQAYKISTGRELKEDRTKKVV